MGCQSPSGVRRASEEWGTAQDGLSQSEESEEVAMQRGGPACGAGASQDEKGIRTEREGGCARQ